MIDGYQIYGIIFVREPGTVNGARVVLLILLNVEQRLMLDFTSSN